MESRRKKTCAVVRERKRARVRKRRKRSTQRKLRPLKWGTNGAESHEAEKAEGFPEVQRRGGKIFRGQERVLKGMASARETIRFPVAMAKGIHLFPSRTQKLSPSALKVLGWTRPGRIRRRRIPIKKLSHR